MSVNNELGNLVRLGDYIEEVVSKVGANNHVEISGINLEQGFIPTVADMTGIDKSKYKLVPSECFACNLMHIGRDVKIPIAYNNSTETIAVSPAYYIFKIKENEKNNILGYYLEMLLTRNEFGRLAWFHTDSSIRGNLLTSELNDIQIPLPDPDIQQELVDTYNGLKALAEQNEELIKPLTEACQAYIVDCKKKYPEIELGEYIEEIDERNTSNEITLTQGVDVNMQFIPAKREAADKEGAKIVRTGQFAFNKVVKANGTKLPIALRTGPDCTISSSYAVFQISSQKLDAKFLRLWFSRSEVHRYCGFISQGTTRDVFSYDDLCNMNIPLPPPEVQQAIVNIYNCAEEAKKIATEARKKMKTLCPALVQRAING